MPKIKKDTIARTITLALALINQILAVLGREVLPFAEEDVYQLISLVFTLAASGIAWWKNNSFTKPALAADIFIPTFRKLDKREKEEAKRCVSA